MPSTKRLKMQYEIRQRTYDRITVPHLRLSGRWLEKAGFEVGQEIEIQISEQQLILTPKLA